MIKYKGIQLIAINPKPGKTNEIKFSKMVET